MRITGKTKIELTDVNTGVVETFEDKNIELNVGANNITIIVANKDGKTKSYSINILRKENGLDISSNTNLSMLDVDGYDIDFDPVEEFDDETDEND